MTPKEHVIAANYFMIQAVAHLKEAHPDSPDYDQANIDKSISHIREAQDDLSEIVEN